MLNQEMRIRPSTTLIKKRKLNRVGLPRSREAVSYLP